MEKGIFIISRIRKKKCNNAHQTFLETKRIRRQVRSRVDNRCRQQPLSEQRGRERVEWEYQARRSSRVQPLVHSVLSDPGRLSLAITASIDEILRSVNEQRTTKQRSRVSTCPILIYRRSQASFPFLPSNGSAVLILPVFLNFEVFFPSYYGCHGL